MVRSGINKQAMDRIRDTLYNTTNEEQTGAILDRLIPENKYNNENERDVNIMSTKKKNATKNNKVNKQNEEKVSMNQEEKVILLEEKSPEQIEKEEKAKKEAEEEAKKEAEEEEARKQEEENKKLKEKLEAEKEAKRKQQEEEDRLFEEEEFRKMQEAARLFEEEKIKKQEEEKKMKEQEKLQKEYEDIKRIKEELEKKQKEIEMKEKELEAKNQEPKLSMEDVQKMISEALNKQKEEFEEKLNQQQEETKDQEQEEVENQQENNDLEEEFDELVSEIKEYFESDNLEILVRKIINALDMEIKYRDYFDREISIEDLQDKLEEILIDVLAYFKDEELSLKEIKSYLIDLFINKLKFSKDLTKRLFKVINEFKNVVINDSDNENYYLDLIHKTYNIIFEEEKDIIIPIEEMTIKLFQTFFNEIKRIVEDETILTGNEDGEDEEFEQTFAGFGGISAIMFQMREEERKNDIIVKRKKYKDNLVGNTIEFCSEIITDVKEILDAGIDVFESTRIGTHTCIAGQKVKRLYYKFLKFVR